MDASDLDMELGSNGFKFLHPDSKLGQLDVNRGSKSGAQVSWA